MSPLRLASLLLLLLSPVLRAQYVVKRVVFLNRGEYPEADLQALAGVKSGDRFSSAALQATAQRLQDTGYFDDVQGSLNGPFASVEVRLALKPIDSAKLLPVGFENFVWFTPKELTAAIEKAVPLVSLGVPEAGNRLPAVQAALEQLLAAKAVTASVSSVARGPSLGHPRRVVDFRVDSPDVILHKAAISGIDPAMDAAMRAALTRINGTHYSEARGAEGTDELILKPYRDLGYLGARLSDVTRTVVPRSDPRRVDVDLAATINAGQQFRVASLQFPGTPLYSAETFATAAKLHPGDLASQQQLALTLAPIFNAYHAKGYMDAVVIPASVLDESAHTVSYTVGVEPGEVYHLKSVTLLNLPPTLQGDFANTFRLHDGDVYDEPYVAGFFKNNTAVRSLNAYAGTYRASADPETHLVDLTITFGRNNGGSVTVH